LKRPASNDRDLLRAAAADLAEAAACLANGRGGTVVVGVRDDMHGPEAIVGVPRDIDVDDIRRRIWQLTSPPLVVDIEDRTVHDRRVLLIVVETGFDLVRVNGMALVNAVAHRDYRHPEPVVVEHSPSRLVVTSPGDLVFGVTEDNLLTHVSKPRNRCLIEALRVLRLAERAGTGVDPPPPPK